MNIKTLSILAVIALGLGFWWFNKEQPQIKPATPATPEVSYEVTQIKAVQTNEQTGEVEYTLTADSLVQNSEGRDEMLGAVIDWQPPSGEKYHLTAKRATFNQETGDLVLSDGFTLVRKGNAQKPDLTIEGAYLTGNTKTRLLSSQKPLSVINAGGSFKAQGFNANLELGEYEFTKVEAVYEVAGQ